MVSNARYSLDYNICVGIPYTPLKLCYPIHFNLVNESAQPPANALPLETLPGGNSNLKQEAGSCADGFDLGSFPGLYAAYLRTRLYDGPICFVPSYSALDVQTVTLATAFSHYIANKTTNPSRPRVARYIAMEQTGSAYNLAHLRFTSRNSEWVFNEMQRPTGNTAANPVNCLTIGECNPYANYRIDGPPLLCTNGSGTYTLAGAPAGAPITWSATSAAGVIFPTTATASLQPFQVRADAYAGTFIITATISTDCGPMTFTTPTSPRTRLQVVETATIAVTVNVSSISEGGTYTATASGTGFTPYHWIIDGVLDPAWTGNSSIRAVSRFVYVA